MAQDKDTAYSKPKPNPQLKTPVLYSGRFYVINCLLLFFYMPQNNFDNKKIKHSLLSADFESTYSQLLCIMIELTTGPFLFGMNNSSINKFHTFVSKHISVRMEIRLSSNDIFSYKKSKKIIVMSVSDARMEK